MIQSLPVRSLLVAAFVLLASGCATSGPAGAEPGPEPVLSVERFLQAANERDLETMAYLFGTDDGPVAGRTGSPVGCAFRRMGSWIGLAGRCASWQNIELQMNTIALILEHDDYRIGSESRVPGRRSATSRVMVDVERDGREYRDVPFVVVRAGAGEWLIEEVGLERITGGR